MKAGKFREDLFYRIHVVDVNLPPLRDRGEDIAPLVDHFSRHLRGPIQAGQAQCVSERPSEARGVHVARQRTATRACALEPRGSSPDPESVLEPEDFDVPDGQSFSDEELDEGEDETDLAVEEAGPHRSEPASSLSEHRSLTRRTKRAPRAFRQFVASPQGRTRPGSSEALRACNWNRVQAAKLSGIPRRTFYRRLRRIRHSVNAKNACCAVLAVAVSIALPTRCLKKRRLPPRRVPNTRPTLRRRKRHELGTG